MIENQINIILNDFKAGHYDLVIKKIKKLLKIYSKNSYLRNLIGSAYIQIGDVANAIINFESSINLSPKNIAALNNLGNAYKKIGDYKLAQKYYLKALNYSSTYINALIGYGNLKIDLQDSEGAIEMLSKVVDLNPNNYSAHFNLATAYQTLNDTSKALEHANKTLNIKPDFTPADKFISALVKYNDNDAHFLKMKLDFDNKEISDFNKIYLHFGLAKAYSDTGNTEKYIENIKSGNFLRKKRSKYVVKQDVDLMSKIESSFKNIDYSQIAACKNQKKIIFIVGMPRSGTSLVEQILSTHSKVFGAGELPFLNSIVGKPFKKKFSINDFLTTFDEMANNYINQISSYSNNKDYILDKNPLNFLWIGFIKILFPMAKIIHIKRNSKDTCYSCFKQLFENINFADDQDDLAQFYNAYVQLMMFWNSNLENFICNINYEELIENPKSNIETMLNFCELDFEEKCLSFNENKNAVRTMSISQVRLPLYKSSINSYKKYEKDLSKLFNNLK
ncbi:sulfotransferase [Candidatus Pelagibacter sp.]|nr:sulfotransferase [Candidatus Pelagibacter sp.]